MNNSLDRQSCLFELSEKAEGELTLRLHGRMDSSNASCLMRNILQTVKGKTIRSLTVDLHDITYIDDFGALVLVELKKTALGDQSSFHIINATDKANEILSILRFESLGKEIKFPKKRRQGIFVHLGDATIMHLSDLKYMTLFIGSLCLALAHVIFHPKSLRGDDTLLYMQSTGVDALPIVALISFLLGLIIAFMSSVQLKQFGANIYVASLVSISMARELGPIMTAIIVAGRSGSSFAAEIGTMKINEEVDALTTMGFEPVRFLVIPKVIASVIMVPFLTLFSDLFAIFGGLIVGVFMLNLTANAYIAQTLETLTLFDVFLGFFKGGIFGFLIVWVGCLRGFQVKGGAASVGQATTSAVVSSLFLIILMDSIFSVILRYWG